MNRLRERLVAARQEAHAAERAAKRAEGELGELRSRRARAGVDVHENRPAVAAAREACEAADAASTRAQALEAAVEATVPCRSTSSGRAIAIVARVRIRLH